MEIESKQRDDAFKKAYTNNHKDSLENQELFGSSIFGRTDVSAQEEETDEWEDVKDPQEEDGDFEGNDNEHPSMRLLKTLMMGRGFEEAEQLAAKTDEEGDERTEPDPEKTEGDTEKAENQSTEEITTESDTTAEAKEEMIAEIVQVKPVESETGALAEESNEKTEEKKILVAEESIDNQKSKDMDA